MLGSRSINLSESIVVALEAMRQALEVFCGTEIYFTGNFQIERGEITKSEIDNVIHRSRFLTIIGKFYFRSGGEPAHVHAEICLFGDEFSWHPVQTIKLTIEKQTSVLDCMALWGTHGDDVNEVRVMRYKDDTHWRVGHGIYDRHLEPLFPRTATE